jgi:putative nucleotidyltransferase with HDIG domain
MTPTARDARAVLDALGAPPRLVRHGELVSEAAQELVDVVSAHIRIDARVVLLGAWLHDAGKALHPTELDRPGAAHEEDGETLLRRHGVDPRVARMCRTHAQWEVTPDVTLEELLVALADKLWKGKRDQNLEQLVVDGVAARAEKDRWQVFTPLDDAFERIAAGGQERLDRSRV